MTPKKADDRPETVPITLRVPAQFVETAEEVAKLMSSTGVEVSPTDAMRAAMMRGFEVIAQESPGTFYISAYDGARTTCIFGIEYSQEGAIARGEALARQHTGGKWTIFRVYREGERKKPLKVIFVKDGGRRGNG
jgi:hypothetical protein